jgi:hypothetical protein
MYVRHVWSHGRSEGMPGGRFILVSA